MTAERSKSPGNAAIRASIEGARTSGRARFVAAMRSLSIGSELAPPLDGLRCFAFAGSRDRFYWERVEHGEFIAAWDCVDELEADGADRFRAALRWRRDLVARIEWIGDADPEASALFVGGFGFDEHASGDPDWKSFPPARFVLPGILVERTGDSLRCTGFARVEPNAIESEVAAALARRFDEALEALAAAPRPESDRAARAGKRIDDARSELGGQGPEYRVRSDRSHARFRGQVEAALAEIGSGRVAKLVLARSLAVDHDLDFELPEFLERLRALYPSCTLVAVGRGRDTFLAATPETLVRVAGRRLETAALAGSAPRGRTPEEDARLAADLLASEKERAEHAHVVDALRAALAPRCEALSVPPAPTLRALFGIQHLESRIEGTLAARAGDGVGDGDGDAIDVLDLVAALHPTPAVAGAPSEAAAVWLRRHEGLERGWYAAPIGWLDGQGGGAFCVGLRSALIRNGVGSVGQSGASRARLFAGAGIVSGSLPEQELVETRIKLRALLAPLTEI